MEGRKFEHGFSNNKFHCDNGHIIFNDGSCILEDDTMLHDGESHKMEDGIVRKCDDSTMKLEKCKLNSMNH